jgi:hypothetical protein
MTHPKIPNYEIMNIPRDPGTSWAYNFGVGVSRSDGPFRLGLDAVYEPIWSHTWADTDVVIPTDAGGTIPPGGRTVENDFRFSNAHLRIGLAREPEHRLGFQLGLAVRSISYDLDQYDFVRGRRRGQDESWMEWVPSWGLSLRFPELQVRYAGRLTSGTGRPGIAWMGTRGDAVSLAANHFILAPSGPLTLNESRVLSHQVAVIFPMGR